MNYTTISETVDAYNEFLDEVYGITDIAGNLFDAHRVLEKLDPIAYKCGWLDWCDSEGIDTDELEDDYTFTRDKW